MIKLRFKSSNSAGFSLVEMMVVVAIIGVMATIAIPNMNKMTEIARQGEAKAQIAAIYAAEKAFYGEFSYYTYCLYQVGYVPDSQVRFYFTGFYNGRGVSDGGLQATYDAVPTPCNISSSIAWFGAHRNDASFEMSRWANPALTGTGLPGNYDVFVRSAFRGVAFGSVSNTAKIMDVWSIDQNKNIIHEQVGI